MDRVGLKLLLDECQQSHIYALTNCLQQEDHPVLRQLRSFDLKNAVHSFEVTTSSGCQQALSYQPVKSVISFDKDEANGKEKKRYEGIGMQAIAAGKVAAVIMSGGQGTRLGYGGPKGMYDIGLLSHKTIFQLHMERILSLRKLAKAHSPGAEEEPRIPVYIMTSDLNHEVICQEFAKQSYFGYPKEDIIFFEQGLEPCFTLDGKIIVDSPTNIAMAPDGNGGLYTALQRTGALRNMEERGVEHLHIYGIDNVLTRSLDPVFMGICIDKAVECGNKVVWRANKSEKVGVTTELDGRMYIVEYSELPPDLAESTEKDSDKLLFGAANICNHYLSLSFVRDVVLPNLTRSYHVAKKKIPYWDPDLQQTMQPTSTNGIKLELFIFDVFPLAREWVVYDVDRDDEFAPVKNAPGSGVDCPETAVALLSMQAKRWLRAAGALLQPAAVDDDHLSLCEISPLVSYAGEGLDAWRGRVVHLPYFLEINATDSS